MVRSLRSRRIVAETRDPGGGCRARAGRMRHAASRYPLFSFAPHTAGPSRLSRPPSRGGPAVARPSLWMVRGHHRRRSDHLRWCLTKRSTESAGSSWRPLSPFQCRNLWKLQMRRERPNPAVDRTPGLAHRSLVNRTRRIRASTSRASGRRSGYLDRKASQNHHLHTLSP